jgi:hypothetical protein
MWNLLFLRCALITERRLARLPFGTLFEGHMRSKRPSNPVDTLQFSHLIGFHNQLALKADIVSFDLLTMSFK